MDQGFISDIEYPRHQHFVNQNADKADVPTRICTDFLSAVISDTEYRRHRRLPAMPIQLFAGKGRFH